MAEVVSSVGQHSTIPVWRHAALAAVLAMLGIIFAFRVTAQSLVEIWMKSDTYMHGFLILPISLWLIWQKAPDLRRMVPRPAPIIFLLLLGNAVVWLLAVLVGVRVVEQLALVSFLILTIWAIVGHRVAWLLAFPLFFLFFAIPMGEDLVPPLMEFTATFTVKMLQITGIPVYRDGFHFVIPSGSWSVVEACSGSRYLIASVTLGFLYAYLAYRSPWRRVLFIAASAVVPIFANGLRAYMIVMIGHLSDMRLAHGVDHLIYGWVFFGIVMMLMFWVGSWWAEPAAHDEHVTQASATLSSETPASRYYQIGVLSIILAVSAAATASWLAHRESTVVAELQAPQGLSGWQYEPGIPNWGWMPKVLDTDQQILATYRRGVRQVAVIAALYPSQRQDAEAVNSQNLVVEQKKPWGIVRETTEEVAASGLPRVVNRTELRQSANTLGADAPTLVTWQWYRLGERSTANSYVGKLFAALNLIYPGRTDGVYVVLATMQTASVPAASETLSTFAREMGASLEQAFEKAMDGKSVP